jgi:hypothetical protein
MRGYLVASLKATPPEPDFLEARDALLAVAQAADPADRSAFVNAFARRGFGPKATGPDRYTRDNRVVVEDFGTTATQAQIESIALDDSGAGYCDKDGVLDVGETGEVLVKLRNTGTTLLPPSTGTVSSSSLSAVGSLSFPALAAFASATVAAPISYSGGRGPASAGLTVTVTNPSLASPVAKTASIVVDADLLPTDTLTFETDPDTCYVDWDIVFAGIGREQVFQVKEVLPTDHVLWAPIPRYPAATYFVTPELEVDSVAPLHVSFRHHYQFRAGGADGALMHISTDDGDTWTRVPGSALIPAYTGTLAGSGFNPLRGLAGWVGTSPQYPAMQVQDVDFSTAYAGKTVRLRWSLGVDQNATGPGWELDDIRITGLKAGSDRPFLDLAAEGGACLNRPPVANAGVDLTADEGTAVKLDASGSSDPDMQALALSWVQTAGPAVVLSGDAFVAPGVMTDTPLTFTLSANDGALASTDEVIVTVRNVNQPPAVTATSSGGFADGTVPLLATGTDPDLDALTYAWSQVAGTPVTIDSADQAAASFFAPEMGTYAFSVTASDGIATSPPATVSVTVSPPLRRPGLPPPCGCSSGAGALALFALLGLRRRPCRRL